MTTNTVAFAGDWHGNTPWAKTMLHNIAEENISTVYHVGDFGVWPGPSGKSYLRRVQETLQEFEQNIYVVPGNHEDYDRIDQMPLDDEGWQFLKDYPNIRFAPRGHVWEDKLTGTKMGALGGAGSIDKNLRNPRTEWWEQEEITKQDVATLIRNVEDRFGFEYGIDILITHEAPEGVPLRGMQPLPRWATLDVQNYCNTQRTLLRNALDATAPYSLIHGHWHEWGQSVIEGTRVDGTYYETDIYSLNCDGNLNNVIAADIYRNDGILSHRVLNP